LSLKQWAHKHEQIALQIQQKTQRAMKTNNNDDTRYSCSNKDEVIIFKLQRQYISMFQQSTAASQLLNIREQMKILLQLDTQGTMEHVLARRRLSKLAIINKSN
jgi:RNA:NAD 2'-phosphotransferase (TPT1/KptA family)